MIICKDCFKGDDMYQKAEFDYWQWFDATENFDDPHGRFCDVCGKEFEDGETVILINEQQKGKDIIHDNEEFYEEYCEVMEYANIKIKNWRNRK